MAFTAPLWLLGLLPWAAFTLWVLTGRNRHETVPFLPLWNATAAKRDASRRWETPPIALVLMLLALLLAILGTARPTHRNASSPAFTLIVDRGLSMSALDHGVPRFATAAQRIAPSINRTARVEIIDPIERSPSVTTGADWLTVIQATPRTGIDDQTALIQTASEALTRSAGEVIVLTDRAIPLSHDRLVVIAPPFPLQNCGITTLVARETPAPQVMVKIRNHSTAGGRTVTVTAAGETVSQKISLPPDGDATAFIDLHALGDVIEAKLDGDEAISANESAYLIRQGDQPRIEVRSPAVGESVRRIAEIYARQRPPTPAAPVIAVASTQDELRTDPGVIVAAGGGAVAIATPTVVADPLTAIVNWNRLPTTTLAPPPRGSGWTPIVSQGNQWLVARRESPARQAWIGFEQTGWAQSPDFVVFWTNVFQWLAGNGQRWDSSSVRLLGPAWQRESPAPRGAEQNAWPGVYRNLAGERIAMNAKAIDFSELKSDAGDVTFPALVSDAGLSRFFLIAAVSIAALALMSWRGRVPGR